MTPALIKIVTRSGREHVMNSGDRYTVLEDSGRRTCRAGELAPGDLLLGAGRILKVEKLETAGTA